MVIDARTPAAFGAGHLPGAIFAGLGPDFLAWLGWLAPYDRKIILVLDHDEAFAEARTDLRRIGLDRVGGYLAGGIDSWHRAGREVATMPQLTVQELQGRRSGGAPLAVLDVRGDDEWANGHIAGASHTFAGLIAPGADIPLDGDAEPIAVICGSGYRSSVANSLLQARGLRNLLNVTGGMAAWQAADLPTTED